MSKDINKLRQQADRGDATAQFEFGMALMSGEAETFDPQQGATWIVRSAGQDYAPAINVAAVFAAIGVGGDANWVGAFNGLRRASELGDQSATKQLALIDPPKFEEVLGVKPPRTALNAPRVQVFEQFIPKAWCDWLIDRAQTGRTRARVYRPDGFQAVDARTNTSIDFRVQNTDIIMQLITARVANIIDIARMCHEAPSIMHYKPGQEFKPHFDFLDARDDKVWQEIQSFGQRVATFLIYLNDNYEGGETYFPEADWRFKGKTGDAILFWNVTPEGKVDMAAKHAGLPPKRGEKWLFSKWIRDRPQLIV